MYTAAFLIAFLLVPQPVRSIVLVSSQSRRIMLNLDETNLKVAAQLISKIYEYGKKLKSDNPLRAKLWNFTLKDLSGQNMKVEINGYTGLYTANTKQIRKAIEVMEADEYKHLKQVFKNAA